MPEAHRPEAATIPAIAEKLGVPVVDVVKAAMSLGLTNTMAQPFDADDAALVEKLVQLDRT